MQEVIVTDFRVVEGTYAVDPKLLGTSIESIVVEPRTESSNTQSDSGKILVTRVSNSNAKVLRQRLSEGKLCGRLFSATSKISIAELEEFGELRPELQFKNLVVVRYEDVHSRRLSLYCAFSFLAVVIVTSLGWLIPISTREAHAKQAQKNFWKEQAETLRPRFERLQQLIEDFEPKNEVVAGKSFLAELSGFNYPPIKTPFYKKVLVWSGGVAVFGVAAVGFEVFLRTSHLVGEWSDWAQPFVHYGLMFFTYPIFFGFCKRLFLAAPHFKRTNQKRPPFFQQAFGVNQLKIIQKTGFQFAGNYRAAADDWKVVAAFVSPQQNLVVCIGECSFSIRSILDSQIVLETKSHSGESQEMKIVNDNQITIMAEQNDLIGAVELHVKSLKQLLGESQMPTTLVSWDEEKLQELLTWSEKPIS